MKKKDKNNEEIDPKDKKIEELKRELRICRSNANWDANKKKELYEKIEELNKENNLSDERNKQIITQILTKGTFNLKWYEIYVELGKLLQIKEDRKTQDILDATNKELTRLIKENYKPNK